MKSVLLTLFTISTIVLGYVVATNSLRLKLQGLVGKTETIERGDISIPINATGTIRPSRRVEIKAEASGEVVLIARQPGERVKAGDLLIRLDPEEEQRSTTRARLDQEVAKANLESAKIDLDRLKSADIPAAKANVAQWAANVEFAQYRWDRAKEDTGNYHEEERLQRKTTYESQLAQLDSAKAGLEKMKLMVPTAEQTVKQSEARFESSRQSLADAERRLSKTDVVSPLNGEVADIRTQIGEVIQGGKTTITGGTVLAVVLDTDRLMVRAEVDEADIGRVLSISPEWALPGRPEGVTMPEDEEAAAKQLENQPMITVESFRDDRFQGVIEKIFPEPTSINNVVTYLVDVVITGENRSKLLPGMRADVRFTLEKATNVLLCPNGAIKEGPGGELGVFVPVAGGSRDERRMQFVTCRFGIDNGNYSEVREGLNEDMVVYTELPAKGKVH